MKKKFLFVSLLSTLALVSCGSDVSLNIGMGDGQKEDDAVYANIVYGTTWKNEGTKLKVRYGHEANAELADEYYLAFSDTNPLTSSSIHFSVIHNIKKADLEERTVAMKGWDFKYNTKLETVELNNLTNFFSTTEDKETKEFYLTFYSSDTNFTDITTYSSHRFVYSFNGEKLNLKDE